MASGPVLGEAWVNVRANTDQFGKDVDLAGQKASKDLEDDLGAGGALGGESLHKGVKEGLDDVERDVESSGKRSAGKLSSALGSGLSGISGIFGAVGGDLGGLDGALDKTGEHLESAKGHGSGLMGELSSLGGGVALGAAAGFAAVSAGSIKLASDFDSSTAQLAASANISTKAAQGIGNAFLSTGGESVFTAQQMVQAYSGVAGQLGLTEGHALSNGEALKVMSASSDLAEASGESLSATTSDLSGVMQAYGLSTKDAAGASDDLYNAARLTGQSVDSVAGTVEKLKGKFGAVAPSLSDTAGLLADMTSQGITGRAAMSGLTGGLGSLLGGSKKTNDELGTLGAHVFDASGKFVGMQSVIGQLGPKFATMNQQQQLAASTAIFGAGAARQFTSVIDAGAGTLAKNTKAVSGSESAHAAAAKQVQTLSHQMELMKAAVEDIAVKWGNVLIPILEKVAKEILKVSLFIIDHKALLIALGIVVGGVLVAAFAAWAIGAATAAAATIAAAWPVLAIIAAIGLLVFGIYELVNHWNTVWGAIKDVALDAWHFIDNNVVHPIVAAFSDAVDWIKDHWKLLVVILSGPFAPILAIVLFFHKQVLDAIDDIWHFIVGTFDHIKDFVVSSVEEAFHVFVDVNLEVASIILGIEHFIVSSIDRVVGFFTALPGRIVAGLGDIASTIGHVFLGAVDWIWLNVLQPLIDDFTSIPAKIGSALSGVGSAISGAFKAGFDAVARFWNDSVGSISFTIPSWVPGLGGDKFGIPKIPILDSGGIVSSPTIALLAANSRPEAVIPLDDAKLRNASGLPTGGAGGGGGASHGSTVVTIMPGAFQVNVGPGTGSDVVDAATSAVEDGFDALHRALSAGVNPLRERVAS